MIFAQFPRAVSLSGCLFGGIFLACTSGNDETGGDGDAVGDGDTGGDGDSAGDGDGDRVGDGDGGGDGDGDGDTVGDGDGDAAGDGDGDTQTVGALCDGPPLCGPSGADDCCARVPVAGGAFPMGRGDGEDACPVGQTCGDHETPEHETTLESFLLDRYEVTVGRFREFVESYDDLNMQVGEGAHPLISGSGWQTDFQSLLPESEVALRDSLNCGEGGTFTVAEGTSEALPVNCVSWAVAFAYCSSIGGRLPTEAEWEFAAAGGDENRLYPWGSAAPDPERASVYPSPLIPAGSLGEGEGRYGNFDLAGNVWEWALDWLDTGWYSDQGMGCDNCARVTTGTHRVLRGGAYSYQEVTLRAAARSGELPEARDPSIGFRCAYSD